MLRHLRPGIRLLARRGMVLVALCVASGTALAFGVSSLAADMRSTVPLQPVSRGHAGASAGGNAGSPGHQVAQPMPGSPPAPVLSRPTVSTSYVSTGKGKPPACMITLVFNGGRTTVPCAAAQPTFTAPVLLDSDSNDHDPSIARDHTGRLYVVEPKNGGIGAPQTPGAVVPTAFVFRSGDGGHSFVQTTSPANLDGQDAGFGGFYTDAVTDRDDALYVLNHWNSSGGTENIAASVSVDHGQTWTGVPVDHPDQQLAAGFHRTWFAYDANADELYMNWQSTTGLHLGRALLRDAARGTAYQAPSSLFLVQDRVVVDALDCSGCFLGSMAVDPTGNVWMTFGQQTDGASKGGIGIAMSSDHGLTWTISSVPGSGADGVESLGYGGYPIIQSDVQGNMYVCWTEAPLTQDPNVDFGTVYYSFLRSGDQQWHAPIRASTVNVALMGTLSVVAPGVVDVAYYGADTSLHRDHDSGGLIFAPDHVGVWRLYVAQSTDAFGGGHFLTDPVDRRPALASPLCVQITVQCDNATYGSTTPGQPALSVDAAGMAEVATSMVNYNHMKCPPNGGRCSGLDLGMSFAMQRAPLQGMPTSLPAAPPAPSVVFNPPPPRAFGGAYSGPGLSSAGTTTGAAIAGSSRDGGSQVVPAAHVRGWSPPSTAERAGVSLPVVLIATVLVVTALGAVIVLGRIALP